MATKGRAQKATVTGQETPAPLAPAVTGAEPVPISSAPMSAADRENPKKLSGDALRELAWRRGISRTECARLTDAKIREQLEYLIHRQYEAA